MTQGFSWGDLPAAIATLAAVVAAVLGAVQLVSQLSAHHRYKAWKELAEDLADLPALRARAEWRRDRALQQHMLMERTRGWWTVIAALALLVAAVFVWLLVAVPAFYADEDAVTLLTIFLGAPLGIVAVLQTIDSIRISNEISCDIDASRGQHRANLADEGERARRSRGTAETTPAAAADQRADVGRGWRRWIRARRHPRPE